jgi:hypothetical protein
MGEGELELCFPSPMFGRGAGGEGKDLSLHCDAPFSQSSLDDFLPRGDANANAIRLRIHSEAG